MDGEIEEQETEGIYLAIGQNQAIGLRNDFFDGKTEDDTKVTALPTCPRCAANKGQWRGYRDRKTGASPNELSGIATDVPMMSASVPPGGEWVIYLHSGRTDTATFLT